MSMNTPNPMDASNQVPPEQMNTPAPTEVQAMENAEANPQQVTPEVQQSNEQAQAQVKQEQIDNQVINEVAQGLADEDITARDIMTAVLSDSLGLSPAGASSLFDLLMTEFEEPVQEDVTVQVQEPDVPPTTME